MSAAAMVMRAVAPKGQPARLRFIGGGGDANVQRALFAYLFVVLASVVVFTCLAGIRIGSAAILSLIIGQAALNIIFFPTRLDFWAEFNSYIGLYGLIQFLTPIAVFVYACVCAVKDRA